MDDMEVLSLGLINVVHYPAAHTLRDYERPVDAEDILIIA